MDNIQIITKDKDGRYSTSLDVKQLEQVVVNGKTVYEKKEPLYKIIALVGPSGCGKTAIMNEVVGYYYMKDTVFYPLTFSTSRPRRENEPKKAYYFYSKEDFEDMLDHDDFIQCSMFNDWYYGLEKAELREKEINIGIFSPQAIVELKETLGDKAEIEVFYIKASDKTRLMRCLQREENPDIKEIIRRYQSDIDIFYTCFSESGMPFVPLANETKEDIEKCVKTIEDAGWCMRWGD